MNRREEKAQRRLERQRHRLALRQERRRFEHLRVIEMIRATTAMERAALRPPFLLNGGALIVYLALYGAVLTKVVPATALIGPKLVGPWPSVAMWLWVAGLIVGTFATAMSFRSQWAFRRHRGDEVEAAYAAERGEKHLAATFDAQSAAAVRVGQSSRWWSWAAQAASVVLFLLGIGAAYLSLPQT